MMFSKTDLNSTSFNSLVHSNNQPLPLSATGRSKEEEEQESEGGVLYSSDAGWVLGTKGFLEQIESDMQ